MTTMQSKSAVQVVSTALALGDGNIHIGWILGAVIALEAVYCAFHK